MGDWEIPACIQPGWIAKDEDGAWYWFSTKPVFTVGVKGRGREWECVSGEIHSISWLRLNFPDVAAIDSLTEVREEEFSA